MEMTEEEKKKYIRRVWNFSDGQKISEMLKRYWGLNEQKPMTLKVKTDKQIRDEIQIAEEVFEDL